MQLYDKVMDNYVARAIIANIVAVNKIKLNKIKLKEIGIAKTKRETSCACAYMFARVIYSYFVNFLRCYFCSAA